MKKILLVVEDPNTKTLRFWVNSLSDLLEIFEYISKFDCISSIVIDDNAPIDYPSTQDIPKLWNRICV